MSSMARVMCIEVHRMHISTEGTHEKEKVKPEPNPGKWKIPCFQMTCTCRVVLAGHCDYGIMALLRTVERTEKATL